MKKEIINRLGNINEYGGFEEFYTIFENIELTTRLRKKGFKIENKSVGFKAS